MSALKKDCHRPLTYTIPKKQRFTYVIRGATTGEEAPTNKTNGKAITLLLLDVNASAVSRQQLNGCVLIGFALQRVQFHEHLSYCSEASCGSKSLR